MNDRFVRKQLFQIGLFYQIDSFNPVYLDKTGELIAVSEGKLKNWNGNMSDFLFSDQTRPYNGKVSMKSFWYSNTQQGSFDVQELPNFCQFIKETNSLIDSVYQPKFYSRIGLRIQFLLRKTPQHVKETYNHIFDNRFKKLIKYGNFNTTALGFDIENEELNVRVNINYATRNTDNDMNAPKDGLLFDLDFFKKLNRASFSDTILINENVLSYVNNNYTEIICNITEELGVINESK